MKLIIIDYNKLKYIDKYVNMLYPFPINGYGEDGRWDTSDGLRT
jgi:hypothetical protein